MTTLYEPNFDGGSQTQVLPSPVPTLMVTGTGAFEGKALLLDRATQVIGRGADCDLRLDNPYMSRRHARLRRDASGTIIEDLDSRAGVVVNGQLITRPTPLHDGDLVRLGEITLEYREPHAPVRRHADSRAAGFDVGAQYGGAIHNVGRDQYLNQLALEIAPMRRRARKLLHLGWALTLVGFAIGVAGTIAYALALGRLGEEPAVGPPDMPFEYLVVGFAGGAVVCVGIACMISSLFIRRGARRREERL
jgi:hypothetical protein